MLSVSRTTNLKIDRRLFFFNCTLASRSISQNSDTVTKIIGLQNNKNFFDSTCSLILFWKTLLNYFASCGRMWTRLNYFIRLNYWLCLNHALGYVVSKLASSVYLFTFQLKFFYDLFGWWIWFMIYIFSLLIYFEQCGVTNGRKHVH